MANPILRSRRYVLAEDADEYVITQRKSGQVVARFPLTDEGYDAVELRFEELNRVAFQQRGTGPRILWGLLITGTLAWLLAGIAGALRTVGGLRLPYDGEWVLDIVFALDIVGYRVGLGALVLLTGTVLLRAERLTREAPEEGVGSAREQERDGSGMWFLQGVAAAGLGVWIASVVATRLLFPYHPGAVADPSTASIVSSFVETLAFRLWVTAGLVIALRSGGRWIAAVSGRDRDAPVEAA